MNEDSDSKENDNGLEFSFLNEVVNFKKDV